VNLRAVILSLLCSSPLAAQQDPVTAGGYCTDLAGWIAAPPTTSGIQPGSFQNTLQNRISVRYYPGQGWRLAGDIRSRVLYQENFNPEGLYADVLGAADDAIDLTAILVNTPDVVAVSQVDRLNVAWTLGALQVTVGRQRVAWGTNLVWNPTDIFNPYSVLDFDYEERPGMDGFRLQYFTGPTSWAEITVAPGRSPADRRAAGMARFNVCAYDISLIAGTLQKGWIAGLNWAGQIGDGGFRGEVRWTGNQHVAGELPGGTTTLSYLTVALSGDYTFPSSLYLHIEGMYNGDGVTELAGLRWPTALERYQLSPARWSLYAETAMDLSPLVRGSVYSIINPLDLSFILVPSVSWSVFTDWDVLVIGLLPSGQPLTEFGIYDEAAFLRVKWSF
jgi:hypothetical protein